MKKIQTIKPVFPIYVACWLTIEVRNWFHDISYFSIDHWNNEHERIVLLTERSFYVIRYDFIQRTVRESRRVGLGQLNSVITGPLVFPAKSLMPIRTSPGVQLMWGDPNEVKVTQKWNPLCRSLPYAILTHHPLLVKQSQLPYGQTTVPGCGYNNTTGHVNSFLSPFLLIFQFRNSEIVIESYGNIGSMVFNQTSLGFTKETHVPPVV
ncbi:unnamed protein product [Protopolystoma xenopodis]|uniref:Inositol phosphatase domain-containing protein n=1 Tax=Protopolystoma xenopodis TaxID=117903 RepID=A0A448XD30_9PLAT|nr:unnamed protein product [Protopolystoma xenopodis]